MKPKRLRDPIPPGTVEQIIEQRRARLAGKQIAQETGVWRSTVSRRRLRAAGSAWRGDSSRLSLWSATSASTPAS